MLSSLIQLFVKSFITTVLQERYAENLKKETNN